MREAIAVVIAVFVAIGGWLVVTAVRHEEQPKPHIVYGASQAIGNGTGRTFVTFDELGTPTSVGVSISEAVLSGLPTNDYHFGYVLPLPAEVSATPFDHVGLDWEPKGHEPAGIYDVPHFDVHFYMISNERRLAITDDAEKFDNVPSGEYLPPDYQKIPGGVPQMGAHWVDTTAPELHGEPFTATFIYGSYDGSVTFVEPMIALSFLKSKPDFVATIKQPQSYLHEGYYYPTQYSVKYNKATRAYDIALYGFVLRQ